MSHEFRKPRNACYDAAGMIAIITGHPVKLVFKTPAEAKEYRINSDKGRPGIKAVLHGNTVTITGRAR